MGEHVVRGRRLGLRKPDRTRPLLTTAQFFRTGVPVHPLTAEHLSQVPAWNGATNQRFGTCGPVSLANYSIMTWKYLLGQDITVSDDAIFDLYRRSGNPGFDPATGAGDDGVDMATMLSAALSGGMQITHADGTTEIIAPVAYALITPGPHWIADMRAATSIFGGIVTAANLEQAQQDQQAVWDYSPSPDWGGHATFGGAYTSVRKPGVADFTNITWQRQIGLTDIFVAHQMDQAFVVIYQAHLDHPAFQDDVDTDVLRSYYTSLTGSTPAW